MVKVRTPQILFIDAYDSFSNNIRCLLQADLNVDVTEIKIDTNVKDFTEITSRFDAVVIGPGPGNPAKADDVGLIDQVWQLSGNNVLPVLGICLGFQSLVLHHGGRVGPLPCPRHGIVRTIRTSTGCIFSEQTFRVVQYHSLHVSLSPNMTGDHQMRWSPSESCPDLVPLAWDCEDDNLQDQSVLDWSSNPQSILMAVKHRVKPFYGVQFHPESICSDPEAREVLGTWWRKAQAWNRSHRPRSSERCIVGKNSCLAPRIEQCDDNQVFRRLNVLPPQNLRSLAETDIGLRRVLYDSLDNKLTVPSICQKLQIPSSQSIVLDSEQHQRSDVGRCSIIGLVDDDTPILEYHLLKARISLQVQSFRASVSLEDQHRNVFDFLKIFMESRKAVGGDPTIPFWGGLMGFISYETCLETIDAAKTGDKGTHPSRPDLRFAFVERSVVIDHEQQRIHVQSIRPADSEWIEKTVSLLQDASRTVTSESQGYPVAAEIAMPDEKAYRASIIDCKTAIRRGDSYELCLTTRATIRTAQHRRAAWPLYLRLRQLNPAPFAAYVRLDNLSLLSSSPERFFSWTRPRKHPLDCDSHVSTCQFRPIKGTVKKGTSQGAAAMSLADAEDILSTPKEKAENLMIVDLIRHDLHGVAGPGNVRVSKLMVVEEYATLFQLVTVIEGDLINANEGPTASNGNCIHLPGEDKDYGHDGPEYHTNKASTKDSIHRKTGIDVLAASLPPGSMTGAPKKRSCQLLQSIERQRPRGVYSGVVGYMDVGGGGDFSVVIRSAVRWDNDEHGEDDVWTVGAGGAVTSLSTEDGEWDEMLTKLKSTLRLFDGEC